MDYKFKLISSLEKIFPTDNSEFTEYTKASMLKNEIFSFQLVCGYEDDEVRKNSVTVKVDSPIAEYVSMREVGYVPSILTHFAARCDEDYIKKTPGIFPDPLYAVENGKVTLIHGQERSVWFTVEPNGEISGKYPVNIFIYDENSEEIGKETFDINIINTELPEQELVNTGWFHTDCIGVIHNVEMLGDEHFELIEKYIDVYTKFGHNMILTPIFTPPLDTAIGGERPTVQLIEVTVENGKYSFKFDNLKRWINICKKKGIKYYEISHLFTQWGVSYAPKVMATVDGEYKRIFGWETAALSDEYSEFLRCLLPELTKLLEEEEIAGNCYFHVSDEPNTEHLENYIKAKEIIYPFIKNYKMIDALSDYEFYQTGAVETPVVATNHVQDFIDNKVENFWVYYCCGQSEKVANRFMAMPSYRNRILGCQLYKNNAGGFLQWGFNFWYSQYSLRRINPYANTDADCGFPSGDSFVVYPVDENGNVVISLRLYVFNDGLQDMRALKLLEQLKGREYVLGLLEEIVNYDVYPKSAEYILKLREKVNEEIAKAL